MGRIFKDYKTEALFALLVAVLAVILDYYWWIRLPLALLAIGIIWCICSGGLRY